MTTIATIMASLNAERDEQQASDYLFDCHIRRKYYRQQLSRRELEHERQCFRTVTAAQKWRERRAEEITR